MIAASQHQANRLEDSIVLVELGELHEAEAEVARILEAHPDDLDALGLFAKIKHIRGELSEAVACWARINASEPVQATAELHLGSMLRLAQDPEAGAGEFLALGRYQLVRKPTAYLALERAFRLYVARQPNEARAHCRLIAEKSRLPDRDVYKLARLAEAWIRELAGEPQEACELLEQLGQERGFETDIDRVLALARLYEQIGTPEKLQAAANISQYLDHRYENHEVLGRLARIYRRLEQTALVAQYEQRHEEAFRRAMHRPNFAQVVHTAARRFLPLERLRALRLPAVELPPEAPQRERAIAAALQGNLGAARDWLAKGQDALDRLYLADLAALEGKQEALRMFCAVLREDPSELQAIGRLLDAHAEQPSSDVASLLVDSRLGPRIGTTLREAVRSHPEDARIWRWLGIYASSNRGGKEESARCAARAAALQSKPVGRALAAAVYHFVGKAKGLVHEVWADREAVAEGRGGALANDQILGNLTDEMKNAVRNIFLSVREYARSKFPHLTGDILDYNYRFKVTKEDERSGGDSAGVPAALAFLSVFLQRPLPQDVASTGVIVADAHNVLSVRAVGEADYKVEAAYHRNLRQIVLPRENRAGLEHGGLVPRAICADIVAYVDDLDDAVKLAFGADIFL